MPSNDSVWYIYHGIGIRNDSKMIVNSSKCTFGFVVI